jgi:lysine 6-dehydrogenase
MKLLVIGAGMMGTSAAFDMARSAGVTHVTIADVDKKLATGAADRVQETARTGVNVTAARLDATDTAIAGKLMSKHEGALSCVPYFFNLGLAKAAISANCHFADLGGNNVVVRKTLALSSRAEKRAVAIAPDCGLSPGLASILAGDLFRLLTADSPSNTPYVDALRLYVGGLPAEPKPPFRYQLVFSVEGLINEYCEPARVLKNGKLTVIEPLTEPEKFQMEGFEELVAFHTSGGTATMPETFEGKVGECFEKTLRYPEHFPFIRGLYDLGLFSSEPKKIGGHKIAPRQVTSALMCERFAGSDPDVTIMRIEAEASGRKIAYEMVDHYDADSGLTSMMRTTAWPASAVLQMIVDGTIDKRGAILQETDVPIEPFLKGMKERGIPIQFKSEMGEAVATH